jgi:hypothetical protein
MICTNPPTEASSLHLLQGGTPEVISRLREEGISSCQQLSLADPVELFVKTNLQWHVILDLIDQALLYTYVGQKIEKLRELGVRSAMEIAALYEMLESEEAGEKSRGKKMLTECAEVLEIDVQAATYIGDTIWHDNQLGLIAGLWEESFDIT